jgi:hypothetical protein
MIEIIKTSCNFCYNFLIEAPIKMIKNWDPFGWYPNAYQVNMNNLTNAIIQQALNDTDTLDRAIFIRRGLNNGTYDLINLRLEPLIIRRLVSFPNLLNQIINMRPVLELRNTTPDQLIPNYVSVSSPTLSVEEEFNLPLAQQEIAQSEILNSSVDLDELQQTFCVDDTISSSINSALDMAEKFL